MDTNELMSQTQSRHMLYQVIAVVGPTASGKSDLADELAFRLNSCVVSADAMQVYKGMDIGTAKTPYDQRRVPLACIDIVEPHTTFSVAEYAPYAHQAIDECVKRETIPVVCGGTGLYVRAALEDMKFPAGDQTDNPVRKKYQDLADRIGAQQLHDQLNAVDPESAALIHPNNVRRVIRAFELLEQGTSYAQEHETLHIRQYRWPTLIVGLTMDRQKLYERINRRVDVMLDKGLLKEVRQLILQGYGSSITSIQAIGYKEIIEALSSQDISTDQLEQFSIEDLMATNAQFNQAICDAVELIKLRSRRYAKRQMTWFRANSLIHWFDVTDRLAMDVADEVLTKVLAV